MEPHYRGLYRRAPCSRVYLAYSLHQLRVGILPPYALDPYNQLRNILQTPQIYTLCSHCPRPVTLIKNSFIAFNIIFTTLSLIFNYFSLKLTIAVYKGFPIRHLFSIKCFFYIPYDLYICHGTGAIATKYIYLRSL